MGHARVASDLVVAQKAGRGDALAAVMAISKADLSLRLLSGIRNRALEAFNEIIRMPV